MTAARRGGCPALKLSVSAGQERGIRSPRKVARQPWRRKKKFSSLLIRKAFPDPAKLGAWRDRASSGRILAARRSKQRLRIRRSGRGLPPTEE